MQDQSEMGKLKNQNFQSYIAMWVLSSRFKCNVTSSDTKLWVKTRASVVIYCSIINIKELDEILKIEFEWPNLTILDILYRFGPFNRTVWPYWRAFSFPTRTL